MKKNLWRTGNYQIKFKSGKEVHLFLAKDKVFFLDKNSDIFDIRSISYIDSGTGESLKTNLYV